MGTQLGGDGKEDDDAAPSKWTESIGARILGALWLAGGLAKLFDGATRFAGVAACLLGIGLLLRPAVMRWPAALVGVAAPTVAAYAMFRFSDILYPQIIVWLALGTAATLFLLFARMTRVRLALGVALLFSYLPAAQKLRTKSPVSAEECAKRVDALNRKVAPYVEPSTFILPPTLNVPTVREGPPARASYPLLIVTPSEKRFQSRLPDDAESAGVELNRRVALLPGGGQAPLFYLAADAKEPVHEIATLLTHVPGARVLLLARVLQGARAETPPPSAEDVAGHLAAVQTAGEAATILADALSRRAAPCAPLAKRLETMNEALPERRPRVLADALDQGLHECQCGWVDVDALEYVAMVLFRSGVDSFAFPIPHDEAGRLRVPDEPQLTVEQWIRRL
jgi:hypothetical protein